MRSQNNTETKMKFIFDLHRYTIKQILQATVKNIRLYSPRSIVEMNRVTTDCNRQSPWFRNYPGNACSNAFLDWCDTQYPDYESDDIDNYDE